MMVVPSKKRQPTLLVVDDNEVATMVMVHNLEYLGCVKKAVELGCTQYLVKPVHPELLLERVGMVLKKQMPVLEDPGMTQDRLKMNTKAQRPVAQTL